MNNKVYTVNVSINIRKEYGLDRGAFMVGSTCLETFLVKRAVDGDEWRTIYIDGQGNIYMNESDLVTAAMKRWEDRIIRAAILIERNERP